MDRYQRQQLLETNNARRAEVAADMERRRYERWINDDSDLKPQRSMIRKTFHSPSQQQQQPSTDLESWLNVRLAKAFEQTNTVMIDEIVALVNARHDQLQSQINELREMLANKQGR